MVLCMMYVNSNLQSALFRGRATLVPVHGPGITVREKQQRLLPATQSLRVSCSTGATTEFWIGVSDASLFCSHKTESL